MLKSVAKEEPLQLEEEESKPRVILTEFKNGKLTSHGKQNLIFTCYKNTNKKASSFTERILVSKSKTMCYVGSNFETQTSKITSSVLKLFIVNKKTSSFEMYDVDYFPLKPQVKLPEIIQIKEEIKMSYKEKSSDLALTFGSKTQQKMINTRKKYGNCAEISDPLAVSKISETTEISNVKVSAENQTPSAIPPQNSSATVVDEVYNLNDIISLDELDALSSNAQVFLDASKETIEQWKQENTYSIFIVQFLENYRHSMDSQKAKLLCYLHYMFCFLRAVYSDWKKKDPVPSVPQPFKQNLMDSFTVNKSMPQRLKDKLIAHALVLGLKLCNYAFNSNLFSSSAKIPMARMTSVGHALGCHITDNKNSGMKFIELKLPLFKFQVLPKKRKRP